MLLDEFLPLWDVRQHHATVVRADLEQVYQAVGRLDLGRSGLNRWLFRARGLPVGRQITLSDLMSRGFVLLGEDPPRELVLGLIARPWTLLGGVRRVDRRPSVASTGPATPGSGGRSWSSLDPPEGPCWRRRPGSVARMSSAAAASGGTGE